MTIDEMTDYATGDLGQYERAENRAWIQMVWNSLKMGGMWYWPADDSLWIKTPDGFEKPPERS